MAESNIQDLKQKGNVMLLFLSLSLFINGEQWTSLVSITVKLEQYFNKDSQHLNWFSTIFVVALAILAFPSVFFPRIFGLRYCIYITTILQTIGCFLKLLISVFQTSGKTKYAVCMGATLFPATAQAFVLSLPSYLSSIFFEPKSRDFKTAIAYSMNLLGIAMGFFISNFLIGIKAWQNDISIPIKILFSIELIVALVTMILCFCFAKEPVSTFSLSSVDNKNLISSEKLSIKNLIILLKDLISIFLNTKIVAFLLASGLCYAIPSMFNTFLSELVNQLTPKNHEIIGYVGSSSIIFGSLCIYCNGYLIAKFGDNIIKVSCLFSFLISIMSLIIILLFLFLKTVNIPLFCLAIILFGGFCSPYSSTGIEILVRLTPSLPPYICSTSALIVSNVLSALFIYPLGYLEENLKLIVSLGLGIGSYVYCCFILFLKIPTRSSEIPIADRPYEEKTTLIG